MFIPALERFMMLLRSTSLDEWERQGRIASVTYVNPWPAAAVALRFAVAGFREELGLKAAARRAFRPLLLATFFVLALAVPQVAGLLELGGWIEPETTRWIVAIWIGD